ncbi:MAG: HD domain-containing protein [Nitrospirae bacterium]|nr:HD domain-containing protein [Nitrospirota bacterium]
MESLEDKVTRRGRPLITNLFILIRITGIYDSMNDAVLNSAKRLAADLDLLLGENGEITLKMIEGSFYIEGIRIKAGISDVENFTALAAELRNKSIGLLDFRAPIRHEDLITLAYAIKEGTEASDIQNAVDRKMSQVITIGGPVVLRREEGIDLKDSRAVAVRAYTKAVGVVKDIDKSIKSGSRIKLKRIKRALQIMVDSILSDESHLVSLTVAKVSGNTFFIHAVNVAILAATLGKRLGMGRVQLRALSMAAFFHDIGKVEIPADILNKKTGLTPGEAELLKRHPVDGVKVILRSFGLNESSILSMLTAHEHHMNIDGSGYPANTARKDVNVFSRIVSIASDFSNMVSGMAGDRSRHGISESLKVMEEKGGSVYDPVLIRVFAGIFRS